jgi:hypothetical protein
VKVRIAARMQSVNVGRNEMRSFLFNTLVPFLCGAIVAVNLERLLDLGRGYHASWLNIFVCLLLAAMSTQLARKEK